MKKDFNQGVIQEDKEMITMTIGEDIMKVQKKKIETDKIRDKNHMNVKITEETINKVSHHVIVKKTNTKKNQIKIIKKIGKVIETENLPQKVTIEEITDIDKVKNILKTKENIAKVEIIVKITIQGTKNQEETVIVTKTNVKVILTSRLTTLTMIERQIIIITEKQAIATRIIKQNK